MFHTRPKPFWPLVCLLLLSNLMPACRRNASLGAGEPFSLWLVTALEGTLEPCGCTSHPLGGLAALTAMIRQTDTSPQPAIFLIGNALVHPEEAPTDAGAQILARKQLLLQTIDQWAPLAYAPGERDIASGVLSATGPLWQRQAAQQTEIVRTAKGAIGLLRWRGDLQVPAIGQAVVQLQQQGVGHVLLLLAEQPQQVPAQFGQTNLSGVLLASGQAGQVPNHWDGIPIFTAGKQGMHVGQLQLKGSLRNMPRPWFVFDDGQQERHSRAIRMEQLTQAIAILPVGPAREARMAMLAHLKDEPITPIAPPTEHSYFTWTLHAIEPKGRQDATVDKAVRQYNQQLCQLLAQQESQLTCPKAAPEQPSYVGNQTCQGCHSAIFPHYETTKHAHAWQTLQDAAKQCDVSCIGCHSVGYGQPGGFCRQQDVERLANVGCESCHGPGSLHIRHPAQSELWGELFVRKPGEQQCAGCHNQLHSDQFDFTKYRQGILSPGHGLPKQPATP